MKSERLKTGAVIALAVFVGLVCAKAVMAYVPEPTKFELIREEPTVSMKIYSFTDDNRCEYLVVQDGRGLSVTPRAASNGYSTCINDNRSANDILNRDNLHELAWAMSQKR